jgi:hypothetical protein
VTDDEVKAAAEKLIDQAVEQGHPRLIEDDRVLAKLAQLSLPDQEGRSSP